MRHTTQFGFVAGKPNDDGKFWRFFKSFVFYLMFILDAYLLVGIICGILLRKKGNAAITRESIVEPRHVHDESSVIGKSMHKEAVDMPFEETPGKPNEENKQEMGTAGNPNNNVTIEPTLNNPVKT